MNGTGDNVEGIPESGTPDGIMSSEGHPRPSAPRGWRSVGGGGSGSKPYRLPPPPHHGVIPPHGATEPSLHVADPQDKGSSSSFVLILPLPVSSFLAAHPGRLGAGFLNTFRFNRCNDYV